NGFGVGRKAAPAFAAINRDIAIGGLVRGADDDVGPVFGKVDAAVAAAIGVEIGGTFDVKQIVMTEAADVTERTQEVCALGGGDQFQRRGFFEAVIGELPFECVAFVDSGQVTRFPQTVTGDV